MNKQGWTCLGTRLTCLQKEGTRDQGEQIRE